MSTEVLFDGTLGFLVQSDLKDLQTKISVTVDSVSENFSIIPKSGKLSLVQVDLTKAKGSQGKTSWTVEVAFNEMVNGSRL